MEKREFGVKVLVYERTAQVLEVSPSSGLRDVQVQQFVGDWLAGALNSLFVIIAMVGITPSTLRPTCLGLGLARLWRGLRAEDQTPS
jgi:hypothetical protein